MSFLSRSVLFILLLVLSGCGADLPLRVASHVWVGYEPMFLARNLGWLSAERVQLEETAAASESMAMLIRGDVDAAALTLDEAWRLHVGGLPLAVVLVFNESVGADALVVRPPLASVADLRGQRVGFESGAVGQLLLVRALAAAGLSLADIQPVDISPDKHAEQWAAGQVDALVSYEPALSELRAAGALTVFDTREVPDLIVDVLVVRRDRLNLHARALAELVAAHLRALAYLQRNPLDAAYRMAPRLGLAPNAVLSSYRGLVLPDARANWQLLQSSQSPLLQTLQDVHAVLRDLGVVAERAPPFAELLESRFLPVSDA